MKEMRQYANKLRMKGHIVTSQWVDGGEESRIEEESKAVKAAHMDIDDVKSADTIIFFGEPRGSANRGGGRWFKLGLAYALGKRCICILDMNDEAVHDHNESGHESVFTHILECYPDFYSAVKKL
jgi:hypothetical protein